MGGIDIRWYNDKWNAALLTSWEAPDSYSSRSFYTELCGLGLPECLGQQQKCEEQNRTSLYSNL